MTHRRISFTTFMDFVTASGPTKLSRIRTAMSMYGADDYHIADYYLDFKHAIARCFGGDGLGALDSCVAGLDDARKQPHYSALVSGLKKWGSSAPSVGRSTTSGLSATKM